MVFDTALLGKLILDTNILVLRVDKSSQINSRFMCMRENEFSAEPRGTHDTKEISIGV